MPTSTSRLSYPDCEHFLQTALEDSIGARLPFPTRSKAHQYQVRLHYYRTLCRQDNRKIHIDREHPLHGRSEFDPLKISIEGPDASGEWWVFARKYRIDEAEIELLSEVEGVAHGS
jgi:hypothetical protein